MRNNWTIDDIIRQYTKHDSYSVKEREELSQRIEEWLTTPPPYRLVIGSGPSAVKVSYD